MKTHYQIGSSFRTDMRKKFSGSMITVAIAGAAVSADISMSVTRTLGQAPVVSATAPTAVLKTPWGEPDLPGIWTEQTDTPLQRPAKYATQELFTAAQRAELDVQRAGLAGKDQRAERGTEADVGGSYNQLFVPRKHTGMRTSMIVDRQWPHPATDGRRPEDCCRRTGISSCLVAIDRYMQEQIAGLCMGKYDPVPSPRRTQPPPRYIGTLVGGWYINRHDGPEDSLLGVRCLAGGLPEFASISFRRIVQTPGGVSMFYDVGQGQGWQRNIVMNGSPHLPANIRQWYGDSRGHWEGDTLVIDVTNFSQKG
jgi:hypothetical protein